MKKILILLVLVLMMCGCNNSSSDNEIEKLMKENEYVIIDVRTQNEYSKSHLVDAINIPYIQLENNINIDKEKIIFVYCENGNRSKIAFNTLKELGYTVYDLGSFAEIDLPKT